MKKLVCDPWEVRAILIGRKTQFRIPLGTRADGLELRHGKRGGELAVYGDRKMFVPPFSVGQTLCVHEPIDNSFWPDSRFVADQALIPSHFIAQMGQMNFGGLITAEEMPQWLSRISI